MTKNKSLFLGIIMSAVSISSSSFADDSNKWYGKLYGGSSILGDQTIKQTGVATAGATGKNQNDGGFIAGGAVGYNYTNNVSVELAWDYTTNDSTNRFSDGTNFNDGDFSSNIFYINGIYKFDQVLESEVRPYLGAGLGYVQEIDMDLTSGGVETSYSQDGEIAYQLMAGASYPVTETIDFDAGIRYVRIDSLDLKREGGAGELRDVDYDPVLFTVGASYKF